MKKHRNLARKICTLLLCVGLLMGSLGGTLFALAAPAGTDATADIVSNLSIPDKAAYGETVVVPVRTGLDVRVMGPSGKAVTLADASGYKSFEAKTLGYYSVIYSRKYNSVDVDVASYQISVEIEHEWVLEVPFAGAAIPTYAAQGSTVSLPYAHASVYEDSDKTKVAKDDNGDDLRNEGIAPSVVGPDGKAVNTVANSDGKSANLTLANQGSYFVTYSYALPSEATVNPNQHALTERFIIKVQTTFNDDEDPTLNLASNPSENANVNVGYVLPKATATDNFDENVEISVEVTKDGVKVAEPILLEDDDQDYAVGTVEGSTAFFDNNKVMKFYPTAIGTYKIVYTATDDSKNSFSKPFYVQVADNLAPVLTIEESAIPQTWGATVLRAPATVGGDPSPLGASELAISFPFPEYRDNSQVYDATNKTFSAIRSIEFVIRDSASRDVVRFSNILDTTDGGNKALPMGVTGDENKMTFTADGFDFNFSSDFVPEGTLVGEYTAVYTARDENNNPSTRSFVIKFENEYRDVVAPTVRLRDVPDYLVIGGNNATVYTVPTPEVQDTGSGTRTKVEIWLTVGAKNYLLEVDEELDFGQAIELPLYTPNASAALAVKGAVEEVVFTGQTEVSINLRATDSVGNIGTAVPHVIDIASTDLDTAFSFHQDTDALAQVSPDADATEVDLTRATKIIDQIAGVKTGTRGVESVIVDNLLIKLEGTRTNISFSGFEVFVTDTVSNQVVSSTSVTATFDVGGEYIILENLRFTPERAGDPAYVVTVKAFDFAGNTAMLVFDYEVVASGGPVWSSVAIADELEQGKPYSLPKVTAQDESGVDINVKIDISGPRYSLMGRELVAKATGNYTIAYRATANGVTDIQGPFTINVASTTSPTIKILGMERPVYVPLGDKVVLPDAVVIDRNGVAMKPEPGNTGNTRAYTVDVSNTKGTVALDVDNNGDLYFTANEHGEYTITYRASSLHSQTNATDSISFTMYAGDIVPPDFSVPAQEPTATQGDFFTFKEVTLLSEEDIATKDKVEYTKRLIAPDGTEYTINGIGESYRTMTNNSSNTKGYELTQTGTWRVVYEVKDAAKVVSRQEFQITVTRTSTRGTLPITIISTVLVIVGVLLLVGVGIYIWRFRPIKED